MGEKSRIHLTLAVGIGRKPPRPKKPQEIVAVDLNQSHLSAAKRKSPAGVYFCVADACNLPFAGSIFGSVYCKDALEHIARYDLALEEMCRVMSTRGQLLLQVPTPESEYFLSTLFLAYTKCIAGKEHKNIFGQISIPACMRVIQAETTDAYGGLYWLLTAMMYGLLGLGSKAAIDDTGRIKVLEAGGLQIAASLLIHVYTHIVAVLLAPVVSILVPRGSALGKLLFKSRRVVAQKVQG